MPIEDSRLKGGTLTLDALPFAKQMTSVVLTPSTETEGEAVEALSGDRIEADETSSWTLELGAIQDFDDPAGFVEYARSNAGDEVAFSWEPNATGAPTYSGTVKVRPVPIGGTVAERLTTTASWPLVGQPVSTPAGP
jgi:hypothetical protein